MVASLRGRAARGALHVLALKAIGTVVGRLSEIILPLFLLPADLGVFALAAFFSGLLALGGELGMSTALVRWKDRFAEAANTAFVLRLALAVALVGGSLALGWGASQNGYVFTYIGVIIVIMQGGVVAQLVKRWKPDPKYAPQSKSFPTGYALKLELGQMSEGLIPGKIFLALPDPEQTVVAGVFRAATSVVEGSTETAPTPAAAPDPAAAAQKAAFEKRYGVKR